MYDGIKKALGPTQSKTTTLKLSSWEIITDKGQQMERWLEHVCDLYSRENIVSPVTLDDMDCLFTMDELEPWVEELSMAIDSLASWKAPCNYWIPREWLKHCKTTLLRSLHEVLCQCCHDGAIPQDIGDSKIITLYKNKGEGNNINNYRGISQLSIVDEIFARVILIRLQKLTECICPESQCGFRAERSTVNMVFSIRQLHEKCREQQMPLYIAFIDLTKAFDLLSIGGLFMVLPKIGWPPKLQSMIESHRTVEQCSLTAAHQIDSKSAAASNKAASLLQRSLGCSLPCCWNMPSTQQQKESTCVPDRMAGSSTLPVSDPIQRSARFSSWTCCMLMTQQLRPKPRRNSCHWWTASHMPVQASDWQSVWWRRTSWERTQKRHRSSQSTTTNSMLSASVPTSVPPSLTTSPWTHISTKGSGTQLLLSLVSWLECGQAPSCRWRRIWQPAMPVLPAYLCMAAMYRLHMPGRTEGIREASAVSWAYPGNTK